MAIYGPIPISSPFVEIMTARPRAGNARGLSHNFITLYGGTIVELIFYEPDPTSFHGEYYYNTRSNQLFKKLATPDNRIVWKSVGEN